MKPAAAPRGPAPPARIIDATLSETLRAPDKILDRDAIGALCRSLPLAGLPAAAPLYPEGAYGWELLLPAARRAVMLEPVTPDAHRNAKRHLQEQADTPGGEPLPLPLAGRAAEARRVLVDPLGMPLPQADADPDDPVKGLPAGWVRERVVTLPAPPQAPRTHPVPTRTGHVGVLARISLLIARMPREERLRIRDPHGAITPELAGRLAGLVDAPRLTLHLENPDGLGPATARAALASPRGPLVRTTLLGIGPRTGLPPTELLRPPDDVDGPAYGHAVAALEEHAGILTPAHHPYWGKNRHTVTEIEHPDDVHKEIHTNPATLEAILDRHLDEWDLTLTRAQHARILARLLATVRPGEDLTGPVLWALVAQEVDLESQAKRTGTA